MLDEMQKNFEDNFTDEEKIQIFNLIFSGYYSLAYIRFLAQKKAGKDLGIEVKEPQNLLPPEGEGADYDDYLDAILAQPNRNEVVEHPNKPEVQVEAPKEEVKPQEEVNVEVPIPTKVESEVQQPVGPEPVEMSTPEVNAEPTHVESEAISTPIVEKPVDSGSSIAASPISSSPLQGGGLSGFPSDNGVASQLESNASPEEVKEEPTANVEETPINNNVVEFGVGNIADNAHEPTIEVIQEDTRPKKEATTVELKFETPEQVEKGENGESTTTIVIPQETSKTEDVPQPSQEVPTVSLEQLQNPTANQN